jgi:selenocysteine lyase/cysteine desulfurase
MIGVRAAHAATDTRFDVDAVRKDFPALHQEVHGKPLAYLDNAATTQKPQAVIDAIVNFYSRDNANVHRGVHLLSERATAGYEHARETVRRFVNAREAREIVFVRGWARATRWCCRRSNTTRTSCRGRSRATRSGPACASCR